MRMKCCFRWMLTLVMLGIGAMALAQEPGPPPAPPKTKTLKVNFAGMDLATMARQVERMTGKSFLFDQNQLRNKKVTLQSETPISGEEFYRVFQAVCHMNGLALVPVEGAGLDLVKIVKAQGAFKEPGAHPVMVKGDAVPNNDMLVSYFVKLKHATPQKIQGVVTANLSSIGTVTQIPNTDLLLINDVASSVRRAEKLITLLDVPGKPVINERVQIQHIPVEKAHSMLQEHWQAMAKVKGGEVRRDQLAMLKDERLNMLYLVGTQEDVQQALKFLAAIDQDVPGAKRTIKYYRLKNVAVKDIVDYVGQLLGVALTSRQAEEAAQSAAPAPRRPGEAVPVPARPAVPAVPPAPAVVRQGGANQANNDAAPPAAELIPVEGLNTLVVAGDAAVHEETVSILENLDRRKGQVLIEVAIVQVTGDDSLDLGVEFLAINDSAGKRAHADTGSGFDLGKQSDPNGRGFPAQTIIDGFTGYAFRYVRDDQFQVILRALKTKGNVGIVSQPLLLVNDNEQASFQTKVSEPTVTSSQGTATTNNSFGGFADATTSLDITPHISPDGYINLEIVQTFEEFQGTSNQSGIPPPKISNSTTTRVTIPDRKTIVIGGFSRDSATESRQGIPGLMRIPGIGKAFSREVKTKTSSRLYLFVRPKVLTMPDFSDLRRESTEKRRDLDLFIKKLPMKEQIHEKVGADEDTELQPLPIKEKK